MSNTDSAAEEPEKTGPAILLAAGGTGGHLFPAEALARELDKRGLVVELATDSRGMDYADTFPADAVHEITAGTVTGGSFGDKLQGGLALLRGVWECRGLLKQVRPRAVVGFGGYPSVPPVLAASLLRIPTVIHEQNAVMGRANRFLAGRAHAVATGFDIDDDHDYVGNPVRDAVLRFKDVEMPPALKGGRLRLLIFGGSQGARIMGEVMPPAIEKIPFESRKRLFICQQAREEDLLKVRAEYARMGVDFEVQPFFKDLPKRMAESHLVIARSGASTVAELAVMGRPSILVPLPGALDQDQAANARVLAEAGAAVIIPQKEFTPARMTEELMKRLADPEPLMAEGKAAKELGTPDAAAELADLVLEVAGLKSYMRSTEGSANT
jgi:UDP-N-acetylglucosamine--N-acetylmuramyl-(pentapeptide) pyrophosphoryl-undecaprenol N-acetylglucosamine transferase